MTMNMKTLAAALLTACTLAAPAHAAPIRGIDTANPKPQQLSLGGDAPCTFKNAFPVNGTPGHAGHRISFETTNYLNGHSGGPTLLNKCANFGVSFNGAAFGSNFYAINILAKNRDGSTPRLPLSIKIVRPDPSTGRAIPSTAYHFHVYFIAPQGKEIRLYAFYKDNAVGEVRLGTTGTQQRLSFDGGPFDRITILDQPFVGMSIKWAVFDGFVVE